MIKLPNGSIHSWPISLGWQLSLKEEEEEEEEEKKKKNTTQHNTTLISLLLNYFLKSNSPTYHLVPKLIKD